MPAKPKCTHIDCFQNKCGARCELLNDYPTDPCPFFKTDKQVEEGRQWAHKRLVDNDRFDLIEQYEHNPQRRW